jgi:ABC-2 type transport system ATP-binding protein
MSALTELLRRFDEAGIEAEDVAVRRPTLDEVFLALTGQPTRSDASIDKEVAA